MRRIILSTVVVVALLGTAGGARADVLRSIASGDWSNTAIWWNDTTGSAAGRLPSSTDDVLVSGQATVRYDLAGSQTFKYIRVHDASTLGWALTDGAADVRHMHITQALDVGTSGNAGDKSNLYIGGSFGGGSIEAADSFKLTFDAGAGLFTHGYLEGRRSERTSLHIAGYDAATRNVEIAGPGGGAYGRVSFWGGRSGAVVKNAYLHDLSEFLIARDGAEAGVGEISGNLVENSAPGAYALSPGGVELIAGNTFLNISNGVPSLGVTTVFRDNTLIRSTTDPTTRTGYGIAFPSYPGYGQVITGNTISGFERAVHEIWRGAGVQFSDNDLAGNRYGISWTNNGGGNAVSFRSDHDVLSGNTVYDLYLANLTAGDAAIHIDGTQLNSDSDPLNELYFMFNNGRKCYLAFRDFDGTVGDYRIWSSSVGVSLSDLLYGLRPTDVLTLESDSAYSGNTPTVFRLTGDLELAGLVLDEGTTLDLNGFTLTVNCEPQDLGGAVTTNGGQILWVPEPATLGLLALGALPLLRRRRR